MRRGLLAPGSADGAAALRELAPSPSGSAAGDMRRPPTLGLPHMAYARHVAPASHMPRTWSTKALQRSPLSSVSGAQGQRLSQCMDACTRALLTAAHPQHRQRAPQICAAAYGKKTPANAESTMRRQCQRGTATEASVLSGCRSHAMLHQCWPWPGIIP